MSGGAGYDAVVDVDDEVNAPQPKGNTPARTRNPVLTEAFRAGRPRPHRPPGRPRIPQLELLRVDARDPQGARVLGPAAAGDGRVLGQALPVVHVLLRAVLRRRHVRRPAEVLGGAVPARQLPRRARGQPGPLRPVLDSHHSGLHPVPGGHHKQVPRHDGSGAIRV